MEYYIGYGAGSLLIYSKVDWKDLRYLKPHALRPKGWPATMVHKVHVEGDGAS